MYGLYWFRWQTWDILVYVFRPSAWEKRRLQPLSREEWRARYRRPVSWPWLSFAVGVFNLLVAGFDATMLIVVNRWPLRLLYLLGLLNLWLAVFNLNRWRYSIWASSTPPTSKSSPLSPSPPSSPSPGWAPIPSMQFQASLLYQSPSPPEPLPVVTVDQPVVGFRNWTVINDELRPMNIQWPAWPVPGTNQAVCMANGGHEAPDRFCHCGLYIRFSLAHLLYPLVGQTVVGAVLASGRLLRHPEGGFRAQRARVLALARRPVVSQPSAPPVPQPQVVQHGCKGLPGFIALNLVLAPGQQAVFTFAGCGPVIVARDFNGKITCSVCGVVTDGILDEDGLERLAEKLHVPLVPAESIEMYAREFGMSIQDLKAEAA